MKATIFYKITPKNDTTVVAISNSEITITLEQYSRIMKSRMLRKYKYMDQDSGLNDVLEIAYKKAVETEKDSEYGEYIENKLVPVEFKYPDEFEAMTEEEGLHLAYRPWID